jgi:hypothetical protein
MSVTSAVRYTNAQGPIALNTSTGTLLPHLSRSRAYSARLEVSESPRSDAVMRLLVIADLNPHRRPACPKSQQTLPQPVSTRQLRGAALRFSVRTLGRTCSSPTRGFRQRRPPAYIHRGDQGLLISALSGFERASILTTLCGSRLRQNAGIGTLRAGGAQGMDVSRQAVTNACPLRPTLTYRCVRLSAGIYGCRARTRRLAGTQRHGIRVSSRTL